MKASFDGARRSLAREFNELSRTPLTVEQRKLMAAMRQSIGFMLCMYDDDCDGDCHDLSEVVRLRDIGEKVKCAGCGTKGKWKLDSSTRQLPLCTKCRKDENGFWRDFCNQAQHRHGT